MNYASISDKEERIARAILGAAYAVHSALGYTLLENVHEICLCHELNKQGLPYQLLTYLNT